jgi:hypothetical protein
VLKNEADDISEAERGWPYPDWKLYVGRLLEIGDGLRLGLVEVGESTASVQVLSPASREAAECVTLHRGVQVLCKGRSVRLVEVNASGPRPWVRVLVS